MKRSLTSIFYYIKQVNARNRHRAGGLSITMTGGWLAGGVELTQPAPALSPYDFPGIATSPLAPQTTCMVEPFELLTMNHVPVEGRQTAISVLPSPS